MLKKVPSDRSLSPQPRCHFLMGSCYRFHQHGLCPKSSLPQRWIERSLCRDGPLTTRAGRSLPRRLHPRHSAKLRPTGTSLLPLTKAVDIAPPSSLPRILLRPWSNQDLQGEKKQPPCQVCLTPACFPHCPLSHQWRPPVLASHPGHRG